MDGSCITREGSVWVGGQCSQHGDGGDKQSDQLRRSSARNIMWYQRGTLCSYQKWADEVGDQSYAFDRFLPYFKTSVHWTAPHTTASNVTVRYNAASFEPKGGPMQVSYSTYTHPVF